MTPRGAGSTCARVADRFQAGICRKTPLAIPMAAQRQHSATLAVEHLEGEDADIVGEALLGEGP